MVLRLLRSFVKSLNELFCVEPVVARNQSRAEHSGFIKAIEDLRREIRSDMRALKESVKFTRESCDEMKKTGHNVKELMKEVKFTPH